VTASAESAASSLFSQLSPNHGGTHVHLRPPRTGAHVAPCKHGSAAHAAQSSPRHDGATSEPASDGSTLPPAPPAPPPSAPPAEAPLPDAPLPDAPAPTAFSLSVLPPLPAGLVASRPPPSRSPSLPASAGSSEASSCNPVQLNTSTAASAPTTSQPPHRNIVIESKAIRAPMRAPAIVRAASCGGTLPREVRVPSLPLRCQLWKKEQRP
jgi:hypothetical protein